jgi:hypothetical protein
MNTFQQRIESVEWIDITPSGDLTGGRRIIFDTDTVYGIPLVGTVHAQYVDVLWNYDSIDGEAIATIFALPEGADRKHIKKVQEWYELESIFEPFVWLYENTY